MYIKVERRTGMNEIASETLASAMRLFETTLQTDQARQSVQVELLAKAMDMEKQIATALLQSIQDIGRLIDIEA